MSKYDDFDLDVKNTEINNGIEPQGLDTWTIVETYTISVDYCQSILINCGSEPSVTTPCTSGRMRVI